MDIEVMPLRTNVRKADVLPASEQSNDKIPHHRLGDRRLAKILTTDVEEQNGAYFVKSRTPRHEANGMNKALTAQ
ncbi:hypothetical protein SODALDRAFT_361236 [Sodiomyces alkalinus F11]|uniref:Uncharacterized protein n=1 Tax=Sodiomyces alkalinus (strain CBS 110278 / VKM F-3762 / F11) TaxID=1314773 RepID=A0A3N2PSP2_SODAK|nr:hypothetical protein SODALDRAFT_361236 [Sodiomyces alkalinus F11]ROT37525.1 hypothetical protein SODALDRAFT_361236 [Sodiomyces alkalinus F11]